MIKKVLLINANPETLPYPVPPLGLSIVANAVEDAGFQVKILDGLWLNGIDTASQVKTALIDFEPDVVGVSIRNIDDIVMETAVFYIDIIEKTCIEPIRRTYNGVTVLGGAGFSIFPGELMTRWNFDYGITGPGEKSFTSLLHVLNNGTSTADIPGLIKNNGENHFSIPSWNNYPPANRHDLSLPFSRLDTRINFHPYLSAGAYPIQTKRGCALGCIYCSYPLLEGNKYRLRKPDEVADEVADVGKRLPGVTIEFVDSTFNHPREHAEIICREIIKRKINVRLRTMGINPAGVTKRLLNLMQEAGFTQIDCTPDSASDRMLKNLKKGFSRSQLEKAATIISDTGMPTMWFFVLGGPGEDAHSLSETFDFIRKYINEFDMVHLTEGIRIYPGTKIQQIAINEGVIKNTASLLKPVYYVSAKLGRNNLQKRVSEFTGEHFNCLRSAESSPTPEMIKEAHSIRAKSGSDEPMFRTLLRIRKKQFESQQPIA